MKEVKMKEVNQMFRVPNTPQGRLFIELVKEYKSPEYGMQNRIRKFVVGK